MIQDINYYIEDYLLYMKSVKMVSINTIDSYTRQLEKLSRWCIANQVNDIEEITAKHLESIIIEMYYAGLAASSRKTFLVVVRSFFKYLKWDRILKDDIAQCIPIPKLEQKIPEIYSVEEIAEILNFTPKTDIEIRNKAILELLYATGVRNSELCNLRICDVKEDGIFVNKAKGGKQRWVPIHQECYYWIQKYIEEQRLPVLKSLVNDQKIMLSPAFVTSNGSQINQHVVRYIVKRSNLSVNGSPHTYRHTFASHMINRYCDVRVLQELMGHENIDTTSRYCHLNMTDVKNKFKKHSNERDTPPPPTKKAVKICTSCRKVKISPKKSWCKYCIRALYWKSWRAELVY